MVETLVANELGDAVRGNYNLVDLTKIYVENPSEHTHDGEFVQYYIDGSVTKGGVFNGQHSAYPLGWGPAGTPSGGGGGGCAGGSYYQNIGGIDIIGSTSTAPKIDKSHWQQANYQSPGEDSHQVYASDSSSQSELAHAVIVGQANIPTPVV